MYGCHNYTAGGSTDNLQECIFDYHETVPAAMTFMPFDAMV